MKITKKQLRQIIAEEIRVVTEGNLRPAVASVLKLMQTNPRVAQYITAIKADPTMRAQFLASMNQLMGVEDASKETSRVRSQQRALAPAAAPTPEPEQQ
jgi:hypothetical protein